MLYYARIQIILFIYQGDHMAEKSGSYLSNERNIENLYNPENDITSIHPDGTFNHPRVTYTDKCLLDMIQELEARIKELEEWSK